MCEKVGIDRNGDENSLAIKLADLLEAQQNIGVEEKNIMVETFAPKKRKEVLEKT
jgi:carbon-monoxide dehydrogenase catalytic subunit